MNHTAASGIPIAVIVLLLSPALGIVAQAQAPAHKPNEMSIWQAHHNLTIRDKFVAWGEFAPIRFSPDSFEYDSYKGTVIRIDLTTAPVVTADCGPMDCRISLRSIPKNTGLRTYLEPFGWHDPGSDTCSADCMHAAESFAAAINQLRALAKDTDPPLRTFPQRAAAWRALATKPPIPEEVRVQRLLAENAIKENNPGEALNHYENGIELYPTWPEGNFNAALIAAELKFFTDAIEHMQAYLELMPDAPDAQAARDKIVIWRSKITQ